ncbi:MAG: FHA domain-containing protein [Polyangiaceae bacterium]|nr:FHA domain-containing protein [Polyangiaceae bacterium]
MTALIPTPPTGTPIKELIAHARTWTPTVFGDAYGPMLLLRVPLDDDEEEEKTAPRAQEGEWTFQTSCVHTVPSAQGRYRFLDTEHTTAYLLRKARGGFFGKTILIGRASSNDICIDHTGISKLHARIRIARVGVMLSDAGSLNGTFLNDQPLAGERAIRDGDTLTLGSRHLRVYDSQKLHGVLRALPGRV